jgi:hypothetical protein
MGKKLIGTGAVIVMAIIIYAMLVLSGVIRSSQQSSQLANAKHAMNFAVKACSTGNKIVVDDAGESQSRDRSARLAGSAGPVSDPA